MLRIRLLGELAVEVDGVPLEPPAGRPARALLGWLALHPGIHARSTVAGTLWPDVLDESARRSLRNALSVIRQSLGPDASDALVATRETVGLAGEPRAWIDIRAFDHLVAAGRREAALDLCRGELLAGLDDDWVLTARDDRRARQSQLLSALAASADAAGDLEGAVAYARHRATLDPLDESAHRDLMRRLAARGDRAGALVAYAALGERLRRELGVSASAQTRALDAQLRTEAQRTVTRTPPPDGTRPASHGGAPRLPARLVQARRRGELLGRESELSHLQAQWELVTRRRQPRLALLAGEPGIGKTRLAAELAARVHRAGAAVLYGRAEEDALCPYQPFVEVLRELSAEESRAPLDAELLLPELDDRASRARSAVPESGAGRLRMFDAVVDELALVGDGGPALLVLDDLHWADRPTLRLLGHLLARGSGPPAMVLGTYRDTELGEGHPLHAALTDLRRHVTVDRLQLVGLSVAAVGDVLERSFGRRPRPTVVRSLHEQTAGNPFFVEELVRSLGQAELKELPSGSVRLPDGAVQAVAQRVRRLGASAQALLTAGALIGPEFDLPLAAEVVGLPADAALDALDAVVQARIVSEVEDAPGRYTFVHALAREALTGSLGAARRARLHALIAHALGARAAADPDRYLQLLAHHALEAAPVGDPYAAVEVAERAAARATGVYAYEDTAALLRRALSVLEAVGGTTGRRAEVLCALGEALERSGASAAAREAFEQVAELARALADARLLARAALGAGGIAVTIFEPDRALVDRLEEALDALGDADETVSARLFARLAIELGYDAGDRPEAASREAVRRARASGDPGALAAALGARHVALWGPEHLVARLECAGEMLAAARRADAYELELQARNWRALDLLELGRGDELRAEVDQFAALASRARLPSYSWYVPMWRATLALMEGRIQEAMEFARREREMGDRAGDSNAEMCFIHHRFTRLMVDERHAEALGEFYAGDLAYATQKLDSPAGPAYRMTLAWLLTASGRADEGRDHFEFIAGDGFSAVPRDVNWLAAMSSAADACLLLRDRPRASELRVLLEPFADRTAVSARGSAVRGTISRLLGQLAAMLGDNDAADSYYAQAEQLDERLGAPVWVAHDLWQHAKLRLALGDRPGAVALLDRAAEIADAASLERVLASIEQTTTAARQPA
jgi:DNA-binding SARP family transcriptional activator/tetratricopeptide (TPR) repeat protein